MCCSLLLHLICLPCLEMLDRIQVSRGTFVKHKELDAARVTLKVDAGEGGNNVGFAAAASEADSVRADSFVLEEF